MMGYSDVRYLLSKRSVDDRALNRHVLNGLRSVLGQLPAGRLQVLELGAGVGTLVSRLSDWGVLPSVDYTLVDRDANSLAAARDQLSSWAQHAESSPDGLSIHRQAGTLEVRFVHGDALEFMSAPDNRKRFHLVVANAVLDLMDLRPALDGVWRTLKPNHPYWFTINFDGESIFLPEAPLDEAVFAVYHRTMDERVRDGQPCGDSKTGRHLLQRLLEAGAPPIAAGSSDWVVLPHESGYPQDEGYFLHHIVQTIWEALQHHPGLEGQDFAGWITERHAQIDRAELIYIAHQLDVLGRAPAVL